MDELSDTVTFRFSEEADRVELYVKTTFSKGHVGWMQIRVSHNDMEPAFIIAHSDYPYPAIPLEKIKELIERYDAKQAEKINGNTNQS